MKLHLMVTGTLLIASMLPVSALEYPPDWVIRGILHVESRSFVDGNGHIQYVDKRVGKHGERGCFQMTQAAFDMVKQPGERFKDLDNPHFAEYKFVQYMRWLGKWATSWELRVMMWNMGPGRKAVDYLHRVRNAGK